MTKKPKPFTPEFFKEAGRRGGMLGGAAGGRSKSPAKLKALARARKILAQKRKRAKKGR